MIGRQMSPLWIVAPVAVAWTLTAGRPAQRSGFPHQKHEKVFPVCEGCHAGVLSGVASTMYPSPADCAKCHDGQRQRRVEWPAPRRRVSNLHFSHVEHGQSIERTGEAATCQTCHAAAGPPGRMTVAGPDPARCLQCHAHAGLSHLAQTAQCSRCHLPVTRATALSAERISHFPRPAWHDSTAFAFDHGRVPAPQSASCAVCHARESCARCHANAEQVPKITSLARDPRVDSLVKGRPPEYRSPPTHRAAQWPSGHGTDVRKGTAGCANCHVQANCRSCHLEGAGRSGDAIRSLPGASASPGLGVNQGRMARAVHPRDIAARHGRLAATAALDCTQCHATRTCAGCHAGMDSRAFHASNFVERHAVEVFAGGSDCQSCHNTERFCRTCHASSGVAAQSRMNAAFHTGQPMWVLSHGQAARMGMESCASCHRQGDCVRCHSAAGGWGVNPHGRGFPARSLASRNSASCAWCHLTNPVGGS